MIPEEGADGLVENPVVAADASGSWQSIVKWGQRAQLDQEQQVAFEVLVATYVLTFYEEANNNLSEETRDETINNKKRLLQLARRDPEETTKKPV